jgi:hypothetical protein
VAALRGHRVRQQAEREAAGAGWTETGYVFTTRTGRPVGPDRLTRMFRTLVAGSGLPVTLHGLRHGAATLALAAGTDLKVVQDQLGHSTIVLTADTYTSVLPETANAAAERTAALLFPTSGCPAKGAKPAARRARNPPLPAWARPGHRKQHHHAALLQVSRQPYPQGTISAFVRGGIVPGRSFSWESADLADLRSIRQSSGSLHSSVSGFSFTWCCSCRWPA